MFSECFRINETPCPAASDPPFRHFGGRIVDRPRITAVAGAA